MLAKLRAEQHRLPPRVGPVVGVHTPLHRPEFDQLIEIESLQVGPNIHTYVRTFGVGSPSIYKLPTSTSFASAESQLASARGPISEAGTLGWCRLGGSESGEDFFLISGYSTARLEFWRKD